MVMYRCSMSLVISIAICNEADGCEVSWYEPTPGGTLTQRFEPTSCGTTMKQGQRFCTVMPLVGYPGPQILTYSCPTRLLRFVAAEAVGLAASSDPCKMRTIG